MRKYKYDLEDHIDKVLYSEEQIRDKVQKMVRSVDSTIRKEMSKEEIWNRPPVAICILRGAAVFMSDLTRLMEVPIEYDFMEISSYKDATEPGEVRVVKDLERSIHERIVLVVEDIVDTGETLRNVLRGLRTRDPRSIRTCALIDKISRRKVDLDVDFTGFTMDKDSFIVGYGMDYAGKYRNLPFIGTLKEELIQE